jgi:acetyltransferase
MPEPSWMKPRDLTLRDGTTLVLRPIRPADESMMVTFHCGLSERTVYYRYFTVFQLDERIAHDRLARICFIDHERELALVAVRTEAGRETEIMAVGRLSKEPGTAHAELALLVSDRWQHRGLGTEMLHSLVQAAREQHLTRLEIVLLASNYGMLALARAGGFRITHDLAAGESRAVLRLEK